MVTEHTVHLDWGYQSWSIELFPPNSPHLGKKSKCGSNPGQPHQLSRPRLFQDPAAIHAGYYQYQGAYPGRSSGEILDTWGLDFLEWMVPHNKSPGSSFLLKLSTCLWNSGIQNNHPSHSLAMISLATCSLRDFLSQRMAHFGFHTGSMVLSGEFPPTPSRKKSIPT